MSITATMLTPLCDAPRVPADASIVLSVAAPGEVFDKVTVTVDGTVVYHYAGVPSFGYPNAFGVAHVQAALQTVTVRMRRRFVPGARVSVNVVANTDLTATYSATFAFSVEVTSNALRENSLRSTRVDTAFPSRVLELYRQAALGAVGSRAGSALVLLIHRVKSSQLACLLPAYTAEALATADRLSADEVEPVSRLTAAADDMNFMWSLAEEELAQLGVEPEVVATLTRGFATDYPQERAAALALTVLLAASRLE